MNLIRKRKQNRHFWEMSESGMGRLMGNGKRRGMVEGKTGDTAKVKWHLRDTVEIE